MEFARSFEDFIEDFIEDFMLRGAAGLGLRSFWVAACEVACNSWGNSVESKIVLGKSFFSGIWLLELFWHTAR